MIEQFLSVQDILGIAIIIGMVIKTIQILYFDKKNKGGHK